GSGAADHGRRVRDGNRFGDAAGGELQADRQAHLPHGADPPPLRAQGLARTAGDRALLDHQRGAGADRPRDVEGAVMLLFDFSSDSQAQRLGEVRGRYDGGVILAAVLLACLGAVMVASSSIAVAEGQHIGAFYYLERHLVFLALGLGIALVMSRIELDWIE